MLTDWFTRPLRAALSEIGLMRKERDWSRIDGMVDAVETKIAALNEHQADHHSNARLRWQRGSLAWQGLAPLEARDIGSRSQVSSPDRSRDLDR